MVQPAASRHLGAGQCVVMAYEPRAPKELQYSVADVGRILPVALLASIFAVVMIAVGRMPPYPSR